MRVVSTLSVFVACLVALTGCGPSRQDYSYYDEGDRYEDRYERARAAREKKRKARKVRQSSARQHAPTTAPRPTQPSRRETAEVVIDPEPVRAPPAAAEPVRAQPVARPPAVAPAVPPMAAAAAPVDEAAAKVAQKQISDGYRLLRAGFVKKAREKFELAMKADAPEASLGQGRSMDPSYLKTVAFPDVIPDAEQARRMYRRAILLGNTEAKGDLERLEKVMAAAQPVTDTETPAASSPPSSLSPSTPANAAPVKPE